MYYVIFRACDQVNAVHRAARPFGLLKCPLIKACFTSLLRALARVERKIIVLGDKLSDELIAFFRAHDVELILGSCVVYNDNTQIRNGVA